jgi:hypothetical protein
VQGEGEREICEKRTDMRIEQYRRDIRWIERRHQQVIKPRKRTSKKKDQSRRINREKSHIEKGINKKMDRTKRRSHSIPSGRTSTIRDLRVQG